MANENNNQEIKKYQPETEAESSTTSGQELVKKNKNLWQEINEKRLRCHYLMQRILELSDEAKKECEKGNEEQVMNYVNECKELFSELKIEKAELDEKESEYKQELENFSITENFDSVLSKTEAAIQALNFEQNQEIEKIKPSLGEHSWWTEEVSYKEFFIPGFGFGERGSWERIPETKSVSHSKSYEKGFTAEETKEILKKGFQASNEQWMEIRKNLLTMKEKYEDEKKAVLAEIEKKDEVIEEKEKKISEKEQDIENLKKEIEKTREEGQEKANELAEKVKECQKEISQTEQEKKSLRELNNELLKEKETQKQEIEQLQRENNDLSEQNELIKWGNIKTGIEKETDLTLLAEGAYWDKEIQSLQDNLLPDNKQPIVLKNQLWQRERQQIEVKIEYPPKRS
jgi:hypothetical protein